MSVPRFLVLTVLLLPSPATANGVADRIHLWTRIPGSDLVVAEGQAFGLAFSVSRESNVMILALDRTGGVRVLFPNRIHTSGRVQAGTVATIDAIYPDAALGGALPQLSSRPPAAALVAKATGRNVVDTPVATARATG
ncbi:MAG: DUF4384 domain-containing protein [Acidobacteriota bacterium]